jgi:hypothetical protein
MSHITSKRKEKAAMQQENTLAKKLRTLADTVEALGIIAGSISNGGDQLEIWTWKASDYRAMVSKLTRSPFVADGNKNANDYSSSVTFPLTADSDLTIRVATQRENVCRRIQTGTKLVTKPAPDAPTIEVEEPVYEWECSPILAASDDGNGDPGVTQ